jgi:hypothetical protein
MDLYDPDEPTDTPLLDDIIPLTNMAAQARRFGRVVVTAAGASGELRSQSIDIRNEREFVDAIHRRWPNADSEREQLFRREIGGTGTWLQFYERLEQCQKAFTSHSALEFRYVRPSTVRGSSKRGTNFQLKRVLALNANYALALSHAGNLAFLQIGLLESGSAKWRQIEMLEEQVCAAAFPDKFGVFVLSPDHRLTRVALPSGELRGEMQLEAASPPIVSMQANGQYVLLLYEDHRVRLFDHEHGGQLIKALDEPIYSCTALCPTAPWCLLGRSDGVVELAVLDGGALKLAAMQEFFPQQHPILLLSATAQGEIVVSEQELAFSTTRALVQVQMGSEEPVIGVSVFGDFVALLQRHALSVWELVAPKPFFKATFAEEEGEALAFHYHGDQIAVFLTSGRVALVAPSKK